MDILQNNQGYKDFENMCKDPEKRKWLKLVKFEEDEKPVKDFDAEALSKKQDAKKFSILFFHLVN